MRLAIITTHPIQYYAPFFKLLNGNEKMAIKVFYTWGESAKQKFDPGFGKMIEWDIPLLEGYDYEWVHNMAANPGSHHFKGIITPGLVSTLISWKPDALLIYGWAYQSHLTVMRHFKNKVPVYFRGDSTLLDEQKGFKRLFKTIYLKWVYSHIDHVFYAGTYNKAYFKKYGLKDSQLSFASPAVDNERFAANKAADALNLRQSLGIDGHALIILFAGKLEPKKAPQLLLDALLSLNMPHVHLLFVGNGVAEKELKTMAGENKNIHFMPFQNQTYMPLVYQACDLFCLPSKGPGETWGLAINEAMASGKPVLVSDKVGCSVDLVVPGFTGDIFKSEDREDLKSKLKSLTGNKMELSNLGINAKNKIGSWTFARQIDAMTYIIKNGAK